MKFLSGAERCIAIAASLTSRYHTKDPLHTTPQNSTFLDILPDHGVLLTMCMGGQVCALTPQANHVAASWIHSNITGPHGVIPGSFLGMVLDPDKLVQQFGKNQAIPCLYPTDAGTDGRDDNGCGPPTMDPDHGSRGATHLGPLRKHFVRQQTRDYKEENFGSIDWSEIPCDFFLNTFMLEACVAYQQKHQSSSIEPEETCLSVVEEEFRAIMGHSVCRPAGLPTNMEGHWFLYFGSESWRPDEWRDVLSKNRDLVERYPTSMHWNEVVVQKPRVMSDIVEAVVYLSDKSPTYLLPSTVQQLAETQARLLGHDIPAIEMKLSGDGTKSDLEFVCPTHVHKESSLEGSIVM